MVPFTPFCQRKNEYELYISDGYYHELSITKNLDLQEYCSVYRKIRRFIAIVFSVLFIYIVILFMIVLKKY